MTNSLVYPDSNVLVYAFCEQPNAEHKQKTSVMLITDLLKSGNLCLSNLTICEFSYILKRLNESNDKIRDSINMLEPYVMNPNKNITQRLNEIMNTISYYKNSFDCYHLAFAETLNCGELITFDKDFKLLKSISEIEITIF